MTIPDAVKNCPCVQAERAARGCTDCYHFGGSKCTHCGEGRRLRHARQARRDTLRDRVSALEARLSRIEQVLAPGKE